MKDLDPRRVTSLNVVEPVPQERCANRRPLRTRGRVPARHRCPRGPARLLAVLLALSGVLLSLSPQPPTVDAAAATLIVPGESIGPARLGMTVEALAAVLGPAARGPAGTLVFPKRGVAADVQGGVAVRLSTTSPQFRTLFGAGVGTRADEAARLIGDANSVVTGSATETTVLYPFQGVGFVFRGSRAVLAFVVERIAIGPLAAPPPAPAAPPGLMPAPPGLPPLSPGTTPSEAPAPRGTAAPAPMPLALRGLAETVDTAGPLFRVTGRVANAGKEASGPVTVTVTFDWSSGDRTANRVAIASISPDAEAPFTLTTLVASDVVTSYTVRVSVDTPGGAAAPVTGTRLVPLAVYTELAKLKIKVDVQLGAPASASPGVQALVSIKETRPIPIRLVKDVLALIPFGPSGQGQQVHVAPGQTVTIIVPAAPSGRVVTPAGTTITTGSIAPLLGEPKILDVTLGAP